MSINVIIKEGKEYLMNTYKRIPIAFTEGKGAYLTDTEGKTYLDMVGGLAVSALGHSHPAVVNAIKVQAEKLLHTSNLYWIENQVKLGKILVENSFADKAFFCNSGAEANEGAIKLARKYSYKNYGEGRNEIISMTGSFHGRTMATLSITANKKYQEGYAPIPTGFKQAVFNDFETVLEAVTENTCAIIIEPVQGEGGVTPADKDFMTNIKKLCSEKDILLIMDEVQVGIGRTGKLFGYENYGIEPDIMTLAKALAGGIPVGAVLAKDEVAKSFEPGDHGTTFGGNPFTCAVGIAAMETVINEKLWENAELIGGYLAEKLRELVNKYSFVKQVKGKGFIAGLELEVEGAPYVEKALEKGVLINCTSSTVLRFLPPLTISKEEVNKLVAVLDEIFSEMGGV
ncbi:aspartate aminotransferase family protein [Serpentinicella alkaliphila]|uniref:Acetylornithine aminotransferase n=1 Tax=Serpentinicella alkaliphila TaxID=1734049 RepID=A0A4R2U4K2_9FIRM|nr:aspartate aminotransferase family protein [Serpentinicella alkaliphila]QUH24614.1 aspartate aminotransferase family protein [Serpentinicella alkaliphila]TCQ02613.1 acetylornithine aminotransferase [Serpentinicella alkaliphila]